MRGIEHMMPQHEGNSARQVFADPDYGRYKGNQMGDSRLPNEPSSEQSAGEEPYSKIYPLPRDKMASFRVVLPMIALGLLLLFGFLFVVVVGGTTGWISFATACFTICCILAYSYHLTETQRR